jgi:Mg-chelatase subunit ChlD
MAQLHQRLQGLIRRHLPGVTASLLAEPRPLPDGRGWDWYTDLAGQPIPLSELSPEDQDRARKLLRDRIDSVARLADEIPRVAPQYAELADPLRRAVHYPGDDYVYLVGDQPVLTFWGHLAPADAKVFARRGLPRAAGAVSGSRPIWPWLALLAILLGGALSAWLWFERQREEDLLARLEEALATGCHAPDLLDALKERLLTLDPMESAYPEIWRRLTAEQERCAAAERLAAALDEAGGDCERIEGLRNALARRNPERPPFRVLAERLEAQRAICETATEFERRLLAAIGDCSAIAALDRELGAPPPEAAPLLRIRARLDDELNLCNLAARFEREMTERLGDCPALHRLDGQLAELDDHQPPLDKTRAQLDRELELCAKAERYARLLLEAQSDCDALEQLDDALGKEEDTAREPLLSIRNRLDELLSQCESLDNLEQALEAAGGDCAKLALIEQRLQQEGPRNPFYLKVKKTLIADLRLCDLADALERALAAAMGDCAALADLEPRLANAPRDDPRFAPLRHRWDKGMAQCRLAQTLASKLTDAGSDCTRLKQLKGELESTAAEVPGIEALQKRFDAVWSACLPKGAETIAKADTGPPTKPGAKRRKLLCPGERPKALAPDLVMVFDASASMDRPIAESPAMAAMRRGLQLGGLAGAALGMLVEQAARDAGGPRRIEVAKESAGRIVRSLPDDVNVGLVLVENCPRARPIGFYSPGQRASLIRGIKGIHPVRGTPLASGIERAADMVDGVSKPAYMVILSDGKESCDRNPCLVARQVARRKPLLTINVVDITGTGAGNCAAQATGGKVYRANNAAEIKSMMQRATQEVRGPAECNRR